MMARVCATPLAMGRQPAATGFYRPMVERDLDAVMAVEVVAYSHPWSRGNFADSITGGHWCTLSETLDGALRAYSVAMPVVDELHLLNLTVSPPEQGRGHAHELLDRLVRRARGEGMTAVLLEVRPSNERARLLYRRHGFSEIGLRRGYYPAAAGQREDALVMRRHLLQASSPNLASHALD